MTLRAMEEDTDNPYMTLRGYNDSYIDIHVANSDMISRRVIIRGIPYRCTDYIRELMHQHKIDNKGRII
jgi:predicted DNA binding CopG/RHH family protein